MRANYRWNSLLLCAGTGSSRVLLYVTRFFAILVTQSRSLESDLCQFRQRLVYETKQGFPSASGSYEFIYSCLAARGPSRRLRSTELPERHLFQPSFDLRQRTMWDEMRKSLLGRAFLLWLEKAAFSRGPVGTDRERFWSTISAQDCKPAQRLS